jgi:hypothetical protein
MRKFLSKFKLKSIRMGPLSFDLSQEDKNSPEENKSQIPLPLEDNQVTTQESKRSYKFTRIAFKISLTISIFLAFIFAAQILFPSPPDPLIGYIISPREVFEFVFAGLMYVWIPTLILFIWGK